MDSCSDIQDFPECDFVLNHMLEKRGEEIDEEFANLTAFFVHDMLNCVLLLNYNHTLMIAQLQRLENNRELKCETFLTKWKSNSQGKVCRHRRV